MGLLLVYLLAATFELLMWLWVWIVGVVVVAGWLLLLACGRVARVALDAIHASHDYRQARLAAAIEPPPAIERSAHDPSASPTWREGR